MSAELAWFGGCLATGLVEISHDPSVLDGAGWWAVCLTYEGELTCARFADVRPAPLPQAAWRGEHVGRWASSMDERTYVGGVESIRSAIAAGEVYQANLCRVLSAPLDPDADLVGLAGVLERGNPAPYAGVLRVPGVEVVSASPELFLSRAGDVVTSRPIKGTAVTAAGLSAKDHAENVMIVDLVRNDLARVARTGSVEVPYLCVVEAHPGLVHLVSTVCAVLRAGVGWGELLAAAFPPGSVTGAPKSSALRIIAELERSPRGPYCGAIGWVDADRRTAALAVGIRMFWRAGSVLRFGTGAGITWASDARAEWAETELKAARLLGLASGRAEGSA